MEKRAAEEDVLSKVQELSDLELALLVSFVADQHCLIYSDDDALDNVAKELQLICSNVFRLSHAFVECSEHTTVDQFSEAILDSAERDGDDAQGLDFNQQDEGSDYSDQGTEPRTQNDRHASTFSNPLDSRKTVNVVIAKNLNIARQQVQIQALELIRSRRIFTRTAVHPVPKRFLLIALLSADSGPRLTLHLNEHLFISHFHDLEDPLPHLEAAGYPTYPASDTASTTSVIKTPSHPTASPSSPHITPSQLSLLQSQAASVTLTAEIRAYLHNILIHLRRHRFIASGISAHATRHFVILVRCLAPLHGMDFVPPSLVQLAVSKVYAHRIVLLSDASEEKSLMYGSEREAIEQALEGLTVDDVIEEVIAAVECPL